MTDDAYRPIACSLHDQLELAAIRLDRLVAVDGIAFGDDAADNST